MGFKSRRSRIVQNPSPELRGTVAVKESCQLRKGRGHGGGKNAGPAPSSELTTNHIGGYSGLHSNTRS